MRKRAERSSKEKVDSGIEEEAPLILTLPKTSDNYQCTGNFLHDFSELCKLMGVKEIPLIKQQRPASSRRSNWIPQRCLWVERESEENYSIKEIYISGWRVDDLTLEVLNRTLPALRNLQCLHITRVGLTDHAFSIIKNTVLLCSNLRKVVLDGNQLPQESYHMLIGEESLLTDLSLRNCDIKKEGARLIGSALSTKNSANKNLVSLNLAFNSIADAGAIYIAQGLRLNRSLLCLSLSYNHIGDTGATHVAEVLGQFPLSHEENVERRRLLMQGDRSLMAQSSLVSLADSHEQPLSDRSNCSLDRLNKSAKNTPKKKEISKKEEKGVISLAGKKEEPKVSKKDSKVPRAPAGKLGEKDKIVAVSEPETAEVSVETVSALLDAGIVHTGGKVIHPGNRSLKSLNLSGNKLTEQSLKVFLSSLEVQGDDGLLRLSLLRNLFPADCGTFLKIQEILSSKDPLNKSSMSRMEDENSETKNT